jgi:diguanylate cyclase
MIADALRADTAPPDERHRFPTRIHRLRMLGLGTGVLSVASVLHQNGASTWTWLALLLNGFAWPHVAYWLARRSDDPQRAELRNLTIDSAMGGAWIAVMQFNVLPSALLAVMLSADKVGIGGWAFLRRTATAQVLACVATSALLGFAFRPESTMPNILWSLPFLAAYPIAISNAAFALGRTAARLNRQLDRLNRTDILTGLWNRMHWEEAAAAELARSRRHGRHAALLLLDIDGFKAINDDHGHPVGDVVMRRVGAILGTELRKSDTPARFGGDEFGVVLADTGGGTGPLEVAERIRRLVEDTRFVEAPDLRCTISIGVTVVQPPLADVAAWIGCTDRALYRAKRSGRNCVVVADLAEATRAAPAAGVPTG